MSNVKLPEGASLEYLKKLVKDRLRELRQADPQVKLATVLLGVARDHGFSNWRALKSEIEQRQAKNTTLFFEACAKGDVEALRGLLANDPGLARASNPDSRHGGWTGLHETARRGHSGAVRLLLEHGADPNAREAGDNTCALHWAVAHGDLQIARALLDAGGDAHGIGDAHQLDVIGWATFFRAPGDDPAQMDAARWDLLSLLLERGARHHIFSAMSVGDLDLIRTVVEQNPEMLDRRMSPFEQGLTPLHFAISRKRHDILALLIEMGADLEAQDRRGLTALAVATLQGDGEAITQLQAAGAKQPERIDVSTFGASMAEIAGSVRKIVPMIHVPDVARTLDWYVSIGFKEITRYEDDGVVNFGMVSFGNAELMLNRHGEPGPHGVSLWFYTNQVDRLYRLIKSNGEAGIAFEEDLNDTFYGAREFGIRDLNGYILYFIQPMER